MKVRIEHGPREGDVDTITTASVIAHRDAVVISWETGGPERGTAWTIRLTSQDVLGLLAGMLDASKDEYEALLGDLLDAENAAAESGAA